MQIAFERAFLLSSPPRQVILTRNWRPHFGVGRSTSTSSRSKWNDNAVVHYAPPQTTSIGENGPLSGWTTSIKDNICTKDMPTTCSSRMLKGYMSPFDATVVDLLRRAGATIIGKTNCDEFGMGSDNLYTNHGPVINPKSQKGEQRVAGGSSGGAAASVASGQCRIAIGSDTGGSVRLPAAYCGVYGFKPSYGLISRLGLVSYADSLDTIGILASTPDDLRSTFDVISSFDAKDPTSITQSIRQRAENVAQKVIQSLSPDRDSLRGLRIGVPQEYFAKEVHSRVIPSVRKALSTLAHAGAEIRPVTLKNTRYAFSAYYVLASAEASSNLARYDGIRYGHRAEMGLGIPYAEQIARSRTEGFGEEVYKRILLGTYSLTSELFDNFFLRAQEARQLVGRDFDNIFADLPNVLKGAEERQEHDSQAGVHALLHPSAIDIAPTIDDAGNAGVATYTQDLLTVPASLAGIPAVSVPMGQADGMPVGVTMSTQWGCESLLWRILPHFHKH